MNAIDRMERLLDSRRRPDPAEAAAAKFDFINSFLVRAGRPAGIEFTPAVSWDEAPDATPVADIMEIVRSARTYAAPSVGNSPDGGTP